MTDKLKPCHAARQAMRSILVEQTQESLSDRACCGNEHDGINKLHGCCVVCGVPFPCEYVGPAPAPASDPTERELMEKVVEAAKEYRAEMRRRSKGTDPINLAAGILDADLEALRAHRAGEVS